jgi:hypothetical protein
MDAIVRPSWSSCAAIAVERAVLPPCSMTRLNRMFPRIVKAEYELPAHVSAPCRDLLSRMLSVDTKRRCALSLFVVVPAQLRLLEPSRLEPSRLFVFAAHAM